MTVPEVLKEEFDRLMAIKVYGVNIGLHEKYAIFACDTPSDVDSAIAICAQWSKGKKVEWTAIPIREDRDVLRERGYVGAKVVDYDAPPLDVQAWRSAMLGEYA